MTTRTMLVALITICAIAIFVGTFVRATIYAPQQEIDVPQNVAGNSVEDMPVDEQPARLQIPSIEVDAVIQYTGLNAKGNMGVPTNFTDVALYKYGPAPGEPGSAVIDGHVDNGLGLSGVFKHLDHVRAGDDIYVVQKDGTKLHFRVTKVTSYPYKDVPTEVLFNHTGGRYLNLITCGGTWIPTEKTYDERVVVYSTLVR